MSSFAHYRKLHNDDWGLFIPPGVVVQAGDTVSVQRSNGSISRQRIGRIVASRDWGTLATIAGAGAQASAAADTRNAVTRGIQPGGADRAPLALEPVAPMAPVQPVNVIPAEPVRPIEVDAPRIEVTARNGLSNRAGVDDVRHVAVAGSGRVTVAQALAGVGLDWAPRVAHIPAEYGGGRVILRDAPDGTIHRLGGLVTDRYLNISNAAAAAPLQGLLDAGYQPGRGGAFDSGAKCYIQLDRGNCIAEVRPGDAIRSMILASWGHGGVASLMYGSTDIRAVCRNTLRAGELEVSKGAHARIRHTANATARLDDLADVIAAHGRAFESAMGAYRALDRRKVSADEVRGWVRAMAPTADETAPSTRARNTRDRMLGYLEGPGGGSATAYDLLNGTTYAAQMELTRSGRMSADAIQDAQLDGRGARLRERGMVYVRTLLPGVASVL